MESMIEPGKIIEVGSEEWKVHIINERMRCKESIKKLEEEIQSLVWYMNNLERLGRSPNE